MALMDFNIDTSGSPQDVQRRQALADALMKQGMDSTPAAGGPGGGWITALNRGLAGALGGYQRASAANEEQQGKSAWQQKLMAQVLQGGKIDPTAMIGLAADPWANPTAIGAANNAMSLQRQEARDAVDDKYRAASLDLQRKRLANDLDNTPANFEANPDYGKVPGAPQYRPIPGGPADPPYIASVTKAKEKGAGDVVTAVTGPTGETIEIPPGADPETFRNEVTRATADAAIGKFNEQQGKALQFAKRMEHAEGTLGKLDNEGASVKGNVLDHLPGGNYLQSSNYQNYKQAQQEFITALLRRESGAAIAQHEFENYGKQFFPQPGDGPEVIAQKRQARWNALNSMRSEAGPAYKKGQSETKTADAEAPEVTKTIGDKTYVKRGDQWFEK
ncbi:hypothetical protein [Bradyrhizobium sp. USDA 4452]